MKKILGIVAGVVGIISVIVGVALKVNYPRPKGHGLVTAQSY